MIDRDYPRMLFHRTEPAVTVYSQVEEEALGPGWSRTIPARQPDQEDEPDDEEEKEPEKKEEPVPVPAEPTRATKRYAHR
jgi:hypothetical protein